MYKMKKITFNLLLMILLTLWTGVSAQSQYSFEVMKSGKGDKAILFLPGFSCSEAVWDSTLTAFEEDFTCYTFTMPGFAGVAPEEHPSFNEWTTSIAQFIKDENLDHPIIVGHSMGGGMAMLIAATYPDLIGKIVVVDALPCLAAMRNPNFRASQDPDCSAMNSRMLSASDEEFRAMQNMTVRMMTADTSRYGLIVGWSMQSDRQTLADIYCQFLNTDLRDTIKNINCPAMILLEPSFKMFGEIVTGQYVNLKQADLRYANKGLHFIMYDDPEWYMNQLKSFLKS
jgi:pimeloyl-ACP methyl ester carboxylesterase